MAEKYLIKFNHIKAEYIADFDLSIAHDDRVIIVIHDDEIREELIRIFTGRQKPLKGEIKTCMKDLIEFRANTGIITSPPLTIPYLTVEENIITVLRGIGIKDAKKRAMQWLNRTRLSKFASSRVYKLPYGIRKLVVFVRAMAKSPIFLFMDEPFSDLKRENSALIKSIINEFPHAFVLFSNQFIEGLNISRIYIFKDGRLNDISD